MAWGADEVIRRKRVHSNLGERLKADPAGLPTHEAVAALQQEKAGVRPEGYDRARSDETSRLEVAELREKSRVANRTLRRQ